MNVNLFLDYEQKDAGYELLLSKKKIILQEKNGSRRAEHSIQLDYPKYIPVALDNAEDT